MRRPLTVAFTLMVATAAGALTLSSAGFADAPAASGWWYEANSGFPVTPPSPPSVPQNGLDIENGFSGPVAISALSFAVPSGAAVGPLVLHIAGSPVITAPPLACPLRSHSFKSTEEGSWTDRPAYDCQPSQVAGKVDSTKTTVTFDVSSLLQNGYVAVAILAGGSADSVSFDSPGSDALTVTAPEVNPSAVSAPTVEAPQSTSPLIEGAPGVDQSALGPPSLGVAPGLPTSAPESPGTTSSSPTNQGKEASGSTDHVASAAHQGSSLPSLAARIVGLAALALLLVAWTEGYGIMGGRIKVLASPLAKRRPRSTSKASSSGSSERLAELDAYEVVQ